MNLTFFCFVLCVAGVVAASFRNVHVNTHHVHSGPRSRIHSILTNGSSIPVRFSSRRRRYDRSDSFSHRLAEPYGPLPYIGQLFKLGHHLRIFPFVSTLDLVTSIFQLKVATVVRLRVPTTSTIRRKVRRRKEDFCHFRIHTRPVILRIRQPRARSAGKRTPTKSVSLDTVRSM